MHALKRNPQKESSYAFLVNLLQSGLNIGCFNQICFQQENLDTLGDEITRLNEELQKMKRNRRSWIVEH